MANLESIVDMYEDMLSQEDSEDTKVDPKQCVPESPITVHTATKVVKGFDDVSTSSDVSDFHYKSETDDEKSFDNNYEMELKPERQSEEEDDYIAPNSSTNKQGQKTKPAEGADDFMNVLFDKKGQEPEDMRKILDQPINQTLPRPNLTALPSKLVPLQSKLSKFPQELTTENFNSTLYILPFLAGKQEETITADLKSINEIIEDLIRHRDYYKVLFNASTTLLDYISDSQKIGDSIKTLRENEVKLPDLGTLRGMVHQLLVKMTIKNILQGIHTLTKDVETVDRLIINITEDCAASAELIHRCETEFNSLIGSSKGNNSLLHIPIISSLKENIEEKKRVIVVRLCDELLGILSGDKYTDDYLGKNQLLKQLIELRDQCTIDSWLASVNGLYESYVIPKRTRNVLDKLMSIVHSLYILSLPVQRLSVIVLSNIEKVNKVLQNRIQIALTNGDPPPFPFITHIVLLHIFQPYITESKIQELVCVDKIAEMINQQTTVSSLPVSSLDQLIHGRPKLETAWFMKARAGTGIVVDLETLFLPFVEYLRSIPVPRVVAAATSRVSKLYENMSQEINTRLVRKYVQNCEACGNGLIKIDGVQIYNTFSEVREIIKAFAKASLLYPIVVVNRSQGIGDEISFVLHKALADAGGCGFQIRIGCLDFDDKGVHYNLSRLVVDEKLFKTFKEFSTGETGDDIEKEEEGIDTQTYYKNAKYVSELMTVPQLEATVHRIDSCALVRRSLCQLIAHFETGVAQSKTKTKGDKVLSSIILDYVTRGDAALYPYMEAYAKRLHELVAFIDDTISYNYFKLLRDLGMSTLAYMDMKSTNILLPTAPTNASDNTISFCMRLIQVHDVLKPLLSEMDLSEIFTQTQKLVSFVLGRFINTTKKINKNGADFLRLNVKEITRLLNRMGYENANLSDLYTLIDSRPLVDN